MTYFLRGDRFSSASAETDILRECVSAKTDFPDFLANLTSRDGYSKEMCLGRDRFPRDGFPTTPGQLKVTAP